MRSLRDRVSARGWTRRVMRRTLVIIVPRARRPQVQFSLINLVDFAHDAASSKNNKLHQVTLNLFAIYVLHSQASETLLIQVAGVIVLWRLKHWQW